MIFIRLCRRNRYPLCSFRANRLDFVFYFCLFLRLCLRQQRINYNTCKFIHNRFHVCLVTMCDSQTQRKAPIARSLPSNSINIVYFVFSVWIEVVFALRTQWSETAAADVAAHVHSALFNHEMQRRNNWMCRLFDCNSSPRIHTFHIVLYNYTYIIVSCIILNSCTKTAPRRPRAAGKYL